MTEQNATTPTTHAPHGPGGPANPPREVSVDVVVLGAGAVGENVADRAGRTGLSVAIVEEHLVGGECSYWACMPSKALLRPGAVLAQARAVPGAAAAVTGEVDVAATLAWRDEIVHGWDDGSQVAWLDSAGITLVRGRGRLTGPRRVVVETPEGEVTVAARHAVMVATGSAPALPDVPGLADVAPWTSREATALRDVPRSVAILGGGVVATEMATALTDLGAAVTMVVRGEGVLPGFEPFAGEAVVTSLRRLGVDVRLRTTLSRAARTPDGRTRLDLADGTALEVDRLLVATGRRPRTDGLGLETVGLEPGAPLRVDASGRVVGVDDEWLWAAGDVTGRTATTHQGKYDARVTGDAIAAAFGGDGGTGNGTGPGGPPVGAGDDAWSPLRAAADEACVPQVVFTRPEVAAVGLTERAAREAGLDVRVVDVPLDSVGGTTVLGTGDGVDGTARIVVDEARRVVVGVTFVGPEVAEMLHAATIAVVGQVPLARLWHAVPAYPTRSEVWLRLLEAYGL